MSQKLICIRTSAQTLVVLSVFAPQLDITKQCQSVNLTLLLPENALHDTSC